jgi:hypothetical protein
MGCTASRVALLERLEKANDRLMNHAGRGAAEEAEHESVVF